ncbi:MAG: hypothetical protein ABGW85_01310 [Sulfurimonas sp.]
MKYSYIKPRKKSPFTPEVQLIVLFFAISFAMLFFTYVFLLYKDYSFAKDKKTLIKKQQELVYEIKDMEKKINYIQKQKALAEKVQTQNMVLKDSIANLFDLVPERITLSRAELLKNGLILYGITPNKDVYNFMLQAPLRSIFQKTYTSFYPAKNGWLMFVSKNYTVNEDEELESED